MKILVTAFEPFGKDLTNSSLMALEQLNIDFCKVIKLVVPTTFKDCAQKVINAINFYKPNAVILCGQAGGRKAITPERIAINLCDAKIPDNSGFMPVDRPVVVGAENAYFTTLCNKQIVQNLNDNQIASALSNSAGTFVCNSLLFEILHYLNLNNINIPCGFIHLPYASEQAINKEVASMPLCDLTRGLEIAIKTVCNNF